MADPTGTEQPIGYPQAPQAPQTDANKAIAALQARLGQLRQQANEVDEDGIPTSTARAARDEIYKAQGELLDWLKWQDSAKSQTSWTSGNTSSPYLVRPKADGTLEQMPNPNYVAPREPQPAQRAPLYPWEQQLGELNVAKAQQDLAGQPTPWQQAQQEYRAQQDAITNQHNAQTQALQKMRDTWGAAQDLMGNTLRAAPMAALPGQQYFVGAEPGGVMQDIYKKSGLNYDPNQFRVPIIQFDPTGATAWEQAQRLIGK